MWAGDPTAAQPGPVGPFHPLPPGVTPTPPRRRRRWPIVLLVAVLVIGGGAIIWRGWTDYQAERRLQEWPEVTATFDHRSARLDYIVQDIGQPRVSAKVDVDLERGDIRVESQDFSWRGDREHWYVYDGIDWVRYVNDDEDLAFLADMDRFAGGMTIDDVLPEAVRTHVRIVDVVESNVGGTAVRHFTVMIDEWRVADDAAASQAMNAWWGETTELPQRYSNLELWIADDGEVLRMRSDSDVDDLFFSVRVANTSDQPFDAELPLEFVDGD